MFSSQIAVWDPYFKNSQIYNPLSPKVLSCIYHSGMGGSGRLFLVGGLHLSQYEQTVCNFEIR